MLPIVLAVTLIAIYATKWLLYLRSLPPGPILPLNVLRHLWWSKFYGKSKIEIFLALKKEYGAKGMFSVNITWGKRIIVMTDFDKVQVKQSLPLKVR